MEEAVDPEREAPFAVDGTADGHRQRRDGPEVSTDPEDGGSDLLISDVLMPELSGIDLAIQTRELYPSCKVLLFSGQPAITGMLEAARANGHDFEVLAKPVHPGELLDRIRVVMDS